MKVVDKLTLIEKEIEEACQRTGRKREDITIIAVTKYVSVERALEAFEAGITHFGENYVQGFLEKWEALGDKPVWHFIGTLQSRKVKKIIDKIDYLHSLDRISLAKEINKRAEKLVKCFVQVNTSNEESKHGISPDETIDFIKELSHYPKIQVVGLMTMAPFTDDEAVVRRCFRTLKNLQKQVQALELDYAPCTELSMGMSNDFVIAVEEGATFVRIGSALVGE